MDASNFILNGVGLGVHILHDIIFKIRSAVS